MPENCSMPSLFRVVKYQTNPPMMADKPPVQASITGCNKFIFCLKETISNAAIVAIKVAIMQGRKISVGTAALFAALTAITLTGINESPVIATLNSINSKDIDFIEILKGPEGSNYGMRGGNGVILVNLVHNRRDVFKHNNNGLQTFYVKGISRSSPFPLINYDIKEAKASPQIDNRSTIFWNGSILTGTQEPVNLNFFTNDISTTFKITITGITVHGDRIYKTITFYNK